MLFDGSKLDVKENTHQTIEVVAEAACYGAHVEGEIEGVDGVEDGIGTEEGGDVHPVEVVAGVHRGDQDRLRSRRRSATPTASTRPTPKLDAQRVTEIVERDRNPEVLHGGPA